MYLEGLGFRAIGRLRNVSHTAVFGWVKQAGEKVESCQIMSDPTLSGKIQKENNVLQQVRGNDQYLTKNANDKTKQQYYNKLTIS